jgi:hypothetical protein
VDWGQQSVHCKVSDECSLERILHFLTSSRFCTLGVSGESRLIKWCTRYDFTRPCRCGVPFRAAEFGE